MSHHLPLLVARRLCIANRIGLLRLAALPSGWPHWAGGMPDDVPPRPGAPGYDAFIGHKGATKHATTPAAAAGNANVETASSGNVPPNDQNVVQGGLYYFQASTNVSALTSSWQPSSLDCRA